MMSPDESDFKNFKTYEEFSKTIEGNKYYHSLYLKAINHPLRREILKKINHYQRISKNKLLRKLKRENLVEDENIYNYNIDYLIKAVCIKEEEVNGKKYDEIMLSGKVVNYLE